MTLAFLLITSSNTGGNSEHKVLGEHQCSHQNATFESLHISNEIPSQNTLATLHKSFYNVEVFEVFFGRAIHEPLRGLYLLQSIS